MTCYYGLMTVASEWRWSGGIPGQMIAAFAPVSSGVLAGDFLRTSGPVP